ncbi:MULTISPECIES: sodium:solute symporter [unclassified Lentimicrobium]|uniref:sodium:solute symporter n=1 Tax=unclassified Lentimicrobium TaxID=2677434 RepID=UPI00155367B6|nr:MULTISPECIES: sodium:solute symporter [unclassified Lentimicrobium]NPD46855.1 sodium:solute symporter [Lentimicrobium sp. S6]NPD84438.1 sodium:solute symporter [Lentimicrobium sp. L6]
MTHTTILLVFALYTLLLFVISWWTSRKAGNSSFFLGDKKSPWYVVAYGMIGASLSGVTFISIPGTVGSNGFSYMMIVLGYLLGYFAISKILLPLYYRLNLTSIYTYLLDRFGNSSYKTGASFFLLSRIIGASFRMFLVINVLQLFVFNALGIPFWITVFGFVGLILLYTYQAGIKTIVWTDTLQTTFMLLAVGITIYFISDDLQISIGNLYQSIDAEGLTKMVNYNWNSKTHYLKQFFSGAFIAIVMTGLDQDMMQKNLSCKNVKEAQKNIISLSWALVPVNFIFLSLGGILFYYAQTKGIIIEGTTDNLFPTIALDHLGIGAGVVFIIGLIAAAYSSADSALTSLTTSFSIDILGIERNTKLTIKDKEKQRKRVHLGMAAVLVLVISAYQLINDQAIITKLFTIAGYTYGPLLGLFAFGLFTKRRIKDSWTPLIAILAPLLSYFIKVYAPQIIDGYEIGFELLIINGAIMFLGLFLISKKS